MNDIDTRKKAINTIVSGDKNRTLTPEEFLRVEIDGGINADNPDFKRLADATAEQMRGMGIETVLDFGAGTGVYSDAFQRAGFLVDTYEIWSAHRDYMREKFPRLRHVDQPTTTDLMLFIEVAEHMTNTEILELFQTIRPNHILFSSTSERTENDAAWGHINVKTQDEWIDFFSNLGYILNRPLNMPTGYTKLFTKSGFKNPTGVMMIKKLIKLFFGKRNRDWNVRRPCGSGIIETQDSRREGKTL